MQGRIQDFKLGGGGGALKKIAPSGGRCENVWGFSSEKSRFYAKKSYFFSILVGVRSGCKLALSNLKLLKHRKNDKDNVYSGNESRFLIWTK